MVNALQLSLHLQGMNIKIPMNAKSFNNGLNEVTQMDLIPEDLLPFFYIWNLIDGTYGQEEEEQSVDFDDDEDDQRKNSNRKKHNRRTAKEINRQYICPYKNCQKVYGSEGSLNLHIKIKHNGGNKTDREKLAKTIIMAHMKGHLCQVIDQIDLNLPPGTISKAAKKYGL